MKQQIEENYKKIGLGLLAVLLVVGLAFTITQNPQTTDIGPDNEAENTPNNAPTQSSGELLPESNSNKTTVYFFWGDGCPYCAKEKPFLEELDKKYEDLEVKMYEVYNSRKNQEIFKNVAEKYGTSARGVPGTFIGQESWRGYNQQIGNEIESKIEECLESGCDSPLQ